MIALINPNFIWIIMNGLFIKNLVAPTNCIVLIVILWEYTDSLIVLFIKIIDKKMKKIARYKTQSFIFLKFSFIKKINGAS